MTFPLVGRCSNASTEKVGELAILLTGNRVCIQPSFRDELTIQIIFCKALLAPNNHLFIRQAPWLSNSNVVRLSVYKNNIAVHLLHKGLVLDLLCKGVALQTPPNLASTKRNE